MSSRYQFYSQDSGHCHGSRGKCTCKAPDGRISDIFTKVITCRTLTPFEGIKFLPDYANCTPQIFLFMFL